MTDELNKDDDLEEEDDLGEKPATGDIDTDDVVIDEDAELSSGESVKKLREKLKTAVSEKQKYLDSWQRDKAEFINARKRDEESKKEYIRFATEKVVEDILPVLDAFEGAMSNKESWETSPSEWRNGVESIYQQLVLALTKHEVKAFGTVGDGFDPAKHHSIGSVSTEDKAMDQTVAEVLQKGYNIREKVLRPALVKIFEC